MTSRTDRALEWVFALVSVVVAWNLDLSTRLGAFARTLGAEQGSILYRLLVDGGVPLVLVGIAGTAMALYGRVIWRYWPLSRCRRGWWVYGLIARGSQPNIQVAGYFFVDDRINGATIPEARAYYVEGSTLKWRGDWSARHVWIEEASIRGIFSMRAQAPTREPLPSHYDGYLQIDHTSDTPVTGKDAWSGYFNDLGDRHQVWGPVVAVRLKSSQAKDASSAREMLDRHAEALIARAAGQLS